MAVHIYLVLLMIGSCINYTASRIPIECRGSVMNTDLNGAFPRNYYRLYCYIRNNNYYHKYDIFHQESKRPFTKRDCKDSGCSITAWQETVMVTNVSRHYVIIDAKWGISLHYLITVAQLKVCKVPMDHNINRIVTFTGNQLNNNAHCVGLHTLRDPVIRLRDNVRAYNTAGLPGPMTKDIFVHVTSDMLTKYELERLNNGEHIEVTIPRPYCNQTTPECHISVYYSPNIVCRFDDRKYVQPGQIGQSTIYNHQDENVRQAMVRQQKLSYYFMIHGWFDKQRQGYIVYTAPSIFRITCDHRDLDSHPLSFPVNTFRKLTVFTSYGPTISFAGVEGAKRIGDHFYFQSDQQQAKFYIMIVSTLEEEYFNISRIDMKLKEGEIIVQKIFRNSLNYTTMYTLILLKLTPLITMVYKLEAGLRVPSIGYKPHNSLVTVKITKLSDLEVVVNPMEVGVVRGDESSKPSFLCVAFGNPRPIIKWSAITSLHGARQVPVNSSLLQKGYIGAYLQFPSAAELTNAYSGEYTCTASNPLLGSKQVTTLLLVFEPGTTYDVFKRYIIENEGVEEDLGEITDDEISLIRRLNSPFITEAYKAIRENKEVVATSVLGIGVGVLVIISLVVWICIKLCRHRKQLKGYMVRRKKKRLATSKND